jgi:hypothetical protein
MTSTLSNSVNFNTRMFVMFQTDMIRSPLYHSIITFIEYITIFVSICQSNYKLGILPKNSQDDINFLNKIDPLFYYKKLFSCNSSGTCTLKNSNFYIIFGCLVSIGFLLFIYVKLTNFQKMFKFICKIFNTLSVNCIDLFFHIGGIFLNFFLFNKFMESIVDFLNCSNINCGISFLTLTLSISILSIFIYLNVRYFLLLQVYVNIEKTEFPYDNLFGVKFNLFLLFQKFLISFQQSLENFKTLDYLSNYIHMVKIVALLFFVLFIFSKITSKKRIYVLNSKLNTFRIFLLNYNLSFIILTLILNDGIFYNIYNLIVCFVIGFVSSIIANNYNSRAVFCDESLISQFIYFLNMIRNNISKIEIEDKYYYFMKYHLDLCKEDKCFVCRQNMGERLVAENRALELMMNIVHQVKYRMTRHPNEYSKTDRLLIKLLKISLKNVFRLNIFTSIYRFKRLIRRKDLGTLYNNVYYNMHVLCSFDFDTSKQFSIVKKYEETLNLFIKSIAKIDDLLIKTYAGIVFGVDLYKLAEELKMSRIQTSENLNYLNSVIFSNDLSESLITLLNIIFRFVFNELPNNHLSVYFKDYAALERRLNEFYLRENYMIVRYNTTSDTLNLVQITGTNLNLNLKQKDRNFEKFFHPLIRKESKELLTKKIKELDTQTSARIDLLVRLEKDYLQMIGLKARVIPSLDFEESVIIGNFQFLKWEFVLVEKYKFFSEVKYYIRLLSKPISELIFLPSHIFSRVKSNSINILFTDIFELTTSSKETDDIEDSEEFIIRYENLVKFYQSKLFNSEEMETLMRGQNYLMKERANKKVCIRLKLKKKEIYKENKHEEDIEKEYILYSFQIKKEIEKSDSDKINTQTTQENDEYDPETVGLMDQENATNSSLYLDTRDGGSRTIESVSASGDFDVYSVRKDSKVHINGHNKNYNNKIKTITFMVTVFNMAIIVTIFIFVYITTTQNNQVIDIVELKGKISTFQYNFYYSILYSFIYYYITPFDFRTKNEYDLRLEGLAEKYPKVDISKLYDFLNLEYNYLISTTKDQAFELKNRIYGLTNNQQDVILNYEILQSNNQLQTSQYKFFDLLNLILENSRIIGENNKMLLLSIFNKIDDKIILSNDPESSISDLKMDKKTDNLHKIAYETIINYKEAYKSFEFFEMLVYNNYDTARNKLHEYLNIFCIIVIIFHVILVVICSFTIKIYNSSIQSVNRNIKDILIKSKVEALLLKIKGVKNLIHLSKDPGEIINTISKAIKKLAPLKVNSEKISLINNFSYESDFAVKFDNKKLIRPYIFSLTFSLFFFVFFTIAFALTSLSGNLNLRYISDFHILSSDISQTLVNDITFTRISILSNVTDVQLSNEMTSSTEDNSTVFQEKGWVRRHNQILQNYLFEYLKMFDSINFEQIKLIFSDDLNCEYIYSIIRDDLYVKIISDYPELTEFPIEMCKSLVYTERSPNLFFNIIEEVNYSNKRLLNEIENSDRSYESLKKIYDNTEFWDISSYILFVIRPIQNYLKDDVVYEIYLTSAKGFHQMVIIFFVFYILFEAIIFYLINYKFSSTLLDSNEKFSEFLNCIQ